nr:uncharacterized protein C17orf80 homolog isoform X2 [Geotrypetes seraphini]
MAGISTGMESCPYCGRPFKRLKSHLPHCKMAGDEKTQTPALTAKSRAATVHSTEQCKKQTKALKLITKNTSKGEKNQFKSESLRAGPERRSHTAGSETEEGKGKPMQVEYKKRQTDEIMQLMTQKETNSLTETTKGILPEMKLVKDTAKLCKKSKAQVLSSQTNVLPKSTLTFNKGKSPMKDLLDRNPTQYAVKSPNQQKRAEALDVSISVLQNLPWNQNDKDKMTDAQERQTAPISVDECAELEYGREPSVSASHHEMKGSNLELELQEDNPAESSCRTEGEAESLREAVCKNNSREKKQEDKLMVALEEQKHLPSSPNFTALPDFRTTQPSLRTSDKEEGEGIDATRAKVMQTSSNKLDSSWSVLKNLELKVSEEHLVKQSSSLALNDKHSCASLPSGSNTIHCESLGLQYFPEFYDSYLRLNIGTERPLCRNNIISGRWKAPLSEVFLSEGRAVDLKLRQRLSFPASRCVSAKQFPAAVHKAWDRHCNKFPNTRKVGAGGLTMLVAGCCILSCAWHCELI